MELDELIVNLENIALNGLRSPELFRPHVCKTAPLPLQRVIDSVRAARHVGRVQDARAAYQEAIASHELYALLGAYREYLTYTERENARMLAAATWVYYSLLPRAAEGDVQLTAKLASFREMLLREYAIAELKTTRGWAESQTHQAHLLPAIWRDT